MKNLVISRNNRSKTYPRLRQANMICPGPSEIYPAPLGAHFLFRARFPCFSKWIRLLYVFHNEKVDVNLFCRSRFCAVQRIRLVLCPFLVGLFCISETRPREKEEEERSRKRAAETLIVQFSIVTSKGSFSRHPQIMPTRVLGGFALLFSFRKLRAYGNCERKETKNGRKTKNERKLRTNEHCERTNTAN